MARSRELPVWLRLPCVFSVSVATTRTPVPSCKPEGDCVVCEVLAPTWATFWYSRSSKMPRLALKPVVLTLARLFAVTVIWVCCASRPVFAAHSAGSISVDLCYEGGGSAGGAGLQQLGGGLAVLVRGMQRLDLQLEAP